SPRARWMPRARRAASLDALEAPSWRKHPAAVPIPEPSAFASSISDCKQARTRPEENLSTAFGPGRRLGGPRKETNHEDPVPVQTRQRRPAFARDDRTDGQADR